MKRVFITALLAVLGALSFVGCDDNSVVMSAEWERAKIVCETFGGLAAIHVQTNYQPHRVRAFCINNNVVTLEIR